MAKRDDKHSMAEDFLQQVESESQHPWYDGSTPPARFAPKWKYKRVFGPRKNNRLQYRFGGILWALFAIATAGYLVFQIFVGHNGTGIFISSLILIVQAIPYLMNREQSTKKHTND